MGITVSSAQRLLTLLVLSTSWRRERTILLPYDQRDRGNLPRQGQARHRGFPPLSKTNAIEIACNGPSACC